MEKKTHFSIWYFIATLVFILLLQRYFLASRVEHISYAEFRKLVSEKEVDDLVVSTQIISGKLKPGSADIIDSMRADTTQKAELKIMEEKGYPFQTNRVEDPDLVSVLEDNGIRYRGTVDTTWFSSLLSWIIPALIFIAFWSFLINRAGRQVGGGLMSVGKSNAKIYVEDEMKVTFQDVADVEEAREELREIIEFLRFPRRFQSHGGRITKGVLLVGPPGTGKTLLAKAVAGEAKVPFFSLVGSDFVEMFVGVGAARVRDLFSQAQEKAPCIIFIDELDALGKARGIGPSLGGHDEQEQTLNQLLSEMDGFDTRKGVIIMAATNRPEVLDPALLRPGRFDRQVLVDRPDLSGREQMFRVHTRGVILSGGVDLKVLAARTAGMVGADIANIVNEAALLAARRNKSAVDMLDFEEAIDRVVGGLQKKNRVMNKKEKEIVAYHETGHALIAETMPTADRVHKISIIPRGIAALGYTLQLPTQDRYLMTRQELMDRMSVLLGGRAAEEVKFGDFSTGAQNDLYRATDIARSMVKEFGMSRVFGPRTFEKERHPLFMPAVFEGPKEYSDATAAQIDREIAQIMNERYGAVKTILETKKDKLDKVVALLMERETIEGDELRRLIAE
jgi:cell division protease FtsH